MYIIFALVKQIEIVFQSKWTETFIELVKGFQRYREHLVSSML